MSNKQPSQSQSISGTSINNSSVSQNLALEEGNISAVQLQSLSGSGNEKLSIQEMSALLEQIACFVQGEQLTEADKVKILRYLGAAQEEMQEEEPNKDLVGGNLKRMAESIKLSDEALAAGQNLWVRVKPLLIPLTGWLGIGVVKDWLGIV